MSTTALKTVAVQDFLHVFWVLVAIQYMLAVSFDALHRVEIQLRCFLSLCTAGAHQAAVSAMEYANTDTCSSHTLTLTSAVVRRGPTLLLAFWRLVVERSFRFSASPLTTPTGLRCHHNHVVQLIYGQLALSRHAVIFNALVPTTRIRLDTLRYHVVALRRVSFDASTDPINIKPSRSLIDNGQ